MMSRRSLALFFFGPSLPLLLLSASLAESVSLTILHDHFFQSIHVSRTNEANYSSVSFSLYARPSSHGEWTYSYEPLYRHAFPCVAKKGSGLPETELTATLYFPCDADGNIFYLPLLQLLRRRNSTYPTDFSAPLSSLGCSPLPDSPSSYRAFSFPLQSLHALPVLSNDSLTQRHELLVSEESFGRESPSSFPSDVPIIRFSYTRSAEECATHCVDDSWILSDTSCYSSANSSGVPEEQCSFDAPCAWSLLEHDTSAVHPNSSRFGISNTKMRAGNFFVMRAPPNKTLHLASFFYSHTSEQCSLEMEARVRHGRGLLIYTERHGKEGDQLLPLRHLDGEGNNFEKVSVRIGHFGSAVRVVIACLPGTECAIDNVSLKECDRHRDLLSLCDRDSDFLCVSDEHAKCVPRENVCDLVRDCHGGEDENACDGLPTSSRCSFDSAVNETVPCSEWELSGSHLLLQVGKLPEDYEEAQKPTGNVLYLNTSQLHKDRLSNLRSQLSSPSLPPSPAAIRSPASAFFNTCQLSFWFCDASAAWMSLRWLLTNASTDTPVEIWNNNWERPARRAPGKCRWRRLLVPIPFQASIYRVHLEAAVLFKEDETETAAIDDISLSGPCFIAGNADENALPSLYEMRVCWRDGAEVKGPEPPSVSDCEDTYLNTTEALYFSFPRSGVQEWIAPASGYYKFESCGAAGGSSEAGRAGGAGGCVVATRWMRQGEKAVVRVGQRAQQCLQQECSTGAGGGATIVTVNDEAWTVAGGGGGRPFSSSSSNGYFKNYTKEEISARKNDRMMGDGLSFAGLIFEDVHSLSAENECTNSSFLSAGGFGGGGSACGQTAGGGGGWLGGRDGRGGSSWLSPSFASLPHSLLEGGNSAAGFVHISPCSVECSGIGQTCVFQSVGRAQEHSMACACEPGAIQCSLLGLHALAADDSTSHLLQAVVFFGAVIGLITVPACAYFNSKRSRIKHKLEELEMLAVDRSDSDLTRISIPLIDRKDIRIKKLIGRGAFGKVYLADMTTRGKSYHVAVKTLQLSNDDQNHADFTFESLTLNKMSHPNIVSALGMNFDDSPYYLVLEYMPGGDLRSFLRDVRTERDNGLNYYNLKMEDLLRVCVDIASGCAYLEQCHHVHRDLAARNILITSRLGPRTAKLGDFGMSRDIYGMEYYRKCGNTKMPVKWLPPESFLDGIFTNKADVWSFGMVCWEVFSLGKMPYPACTNEEVMDMVTSGKRLIPPTGTPKEVSSLIHRCWHAHPGYRPVFASIVHEFEFLVGDPLVAELPLPEGEMVLPFTYIHETNCGFPSPPRPIRPQDLNSSGVSCAETMSTVLSSLPNEYSPTPSSPPPTHSLLV